MKYIADENFPGPAIKKLRGIGFDVLWIREVSPGVNDFEVIRKAIETSRVLLTFDKDFGELAHVKGVSSKFGVILFRISTKNPIEATNIIISILKKDIDWAGNFSVVTANGIRSIKC